MICNIGRVHRALRLLMGLGALGVGAAALGFLVRAEAHAAWRLALAPVWWVAALGFLQASLGTCVAFAARGQRALEGLGTEPTPEEMIAAIKRKGRKISMASILLAAAVTGASLPF
jgi:hypothetical protein